MPRICPLCGFPAAVLLFFCASFAAAQTPPAVESVSFINTPDSGDTYTLGETIQIAVTFDADIELIGTQTRPQLMLNIGGERQRAGWYDWDGYTYGGRPGRTLFFKHVVQASDHDADGVGIPAGEVSVSDGGVALADNPSVKADLSFPEVSDDPTRRVDSSVVRAPKVSAIEIISHPYIDGIFELGDWIRFRVSFDKAVLVTGTPELGLTIGAQTRYAVHDGWWPSRANAAQVFEYVVQETDYDADGISIAADALNLKDGTIRAAQGAVDADLSHAAMADDPTLKVDGSKVTKPSVSGFDFRPPARGGTYEAGEWIKARVNFNRYIEVTGEPQLALTMGAETQQAACGYGGRSSWGKSHMSCYHRVHATDRAADGISIEANAISLNGGTVTAAADGSVNADLTHGARPADSELKVDGGLNGAPKVSSVLFENHPENGDTYGLGEVIEVVVRFDREVMTTGPLQIALTIGENTRQVMFRDHSNVSEYYGYLFFFDYAVQATDFDADGISIPANALKLASGVIGGSHDRTAAADLSHEGTVDDPSRKVNGDSSGSPGQEEEASPAAAPKVDYVYFVVPPIAGDTFKKGGLIGALATFNRAVRVSGNPQLALTIGTQTRQADYVPLTFFGPKSLLFFYLVQAADKDDDGISIAANAITLNGGAIQAVDGTTAADLRHAAVPPNPDLKVDGGG